MQTLKVSSQSSPNSVAGAIAAILRNNDKAEIYAIGAGAVNQGVKGIAIARGYVAANDIDLVTIPSFSKIDVDGEERTSVKFIVEKR